MAKIRVFHVVGDAQYHGTCRMHLFADCRHLTRPRSMGPMDMTGTTEEAMIEETSRHICRHCVKRAAAPLSAPTCRNSP